jgi:anti-anti-sigma factor
MAAFPTPSEGRTNPNFGITTEGSRMFFLEGELDPATVPLMHTAIGEAISRGGPLTIDMSDVSFVDSSGVGAILNYVKALPSGWIILHGVHNGVGKLMNIMGVEHPPKLLVILHPALARGDRAPDVGPGFEETFRRCNSVSDIESIASHRR